jgi:hypothetical protein
MAMQATEQSAVTERKCIKIKLLSVGVIIFAAFLITQKADAAYTPQPGDVVRTEANPTVFLIDDQKARIPLSADAYQVRYNNDFSLIKFVTAEELGNWSDIFTLNKKSSVPNGSLIIYHTDKPTIYLVENGFKRPIATYQKFLSLGYSMDSVEWVGQHSVFPTGEPIQ